MNQPPRKDNEKAWRVTVSPTDVKKLKSIPSQQSSVEMSKTFKFTFGDWKNKDTKSGNNSCEKDTSNLLSTTSTRNLIINWD